MQLVSCQNPKIIVNKYTKERLSVPCGVCPACRNFKTLDFVNRIKIESEQHEFTYFFTLTYDEKHLPKAYLQKSDEDFADYLLFYNPNTCKCEDKLVLSTSALEQSFSESLARSGNENYLSYASKVDLQNFLKRLRKSISKLYSEENNKIRYFAVSEYGKLHLRSHYHGILWCDSRLIASELVSLVHKAWSFGRSDVQLSLDKSGEYVAKYINSTCVYPELYSYSRFKSFYLSSRQPPVGCFRSCSETLQKEVKRTVIENVIQGQKKLSIVTVSRSFKNRYYPKCRGFSKLSFSDKLSAYNTCFKVRFEEIGDNRELKRDWYVSKRVHNLARLNGVSVAYYVILICRFYDKLSMFNLNLFYEFQKDYARKFGAITLLCLYPVAFNDFLLNYQSGNFEHCAFVLSCFSTEDYRLNDDFIESHFNLSKMESVFNFFKLQFEIAENSIKTRIINETLKPF